MPLNSFSTSICNIQKIPDLSCNIIQIKKKKFSPAGDEEWSLEDPTEEPPGLQLDSWAEETIGMDEGWPIMLVRDVMFMWSEEAAEWQPIWSWCSAEDGGRRDSELVGVGEYTEDPTDPSMEVSP